MSFSKCPVTDLDAELMFLDLHESFDDFLIFVEGQPECFKWLIDLVFLIFLINLSTVDEV